MWNIFEQPWALLILAIVILIVVAIIRAVLPEKRRWWQWLLPVLFVIAAFGLDFFVKTDFEKIKTVLKTGVNAVKNEDPSAIENILTNDYRDSRHRNKDAIMRNCRFFFSQPLVDKTYTTILQTDISAPDATLVILVRILFDEKSEVSDFVRIMLVKAEVRLQKQPKGNWLINRTEILAMNNQPAKWHDVKHNGW